MRQLKRLAIVLFSATLAACSTVPKQKAYDPSKSLALNLVEAAGIEDLKDQTVSAEDYDKLHSSGAGVVAGLGWAGANFAMPAPGFSSGWGFGLGMLSMIRSTKIPAKRRQLVAWMPKSMASDAQEAQRQLVELSEQALRTALNDLGWKHVLMARTTLSSGGVFFGAWVVDEALGCAPSEAATKEKCLVAIHISKPVSGGPAPDIINSDAADTYFFEPNIYGQSLVTFANRGNNKMNAQAFYMSLSRNMPEWLFFYFPPKDYIDIDPDANLDYPQVYYKGGQELFVRTR